MSVQPVPAVALAGQPLAAGRAPGGGWPAAPMVLDGLTVTWGRSGVLEQPTPATASVRIFDPSGVWAAGVDLVGQPLELSWTAAGTTRVYFTGRVGAVAVEPHVGMLDNVRTDGALVSLSCTSLLADLGNRRPSEATWPAETLAARRARIAALAAGPVASIATRPAWDAAPLAALDVSGTTCLELIKTLFDNCGADRYSYDPHTRAIGYLTRRAFTEPNALAYLTRDASRPGAYLRAPGGALDGHRVTYPGAASRDAASRLTRVQLTYPGAVSKGYTVVLPGVDEAALGVRAASVATQHTDDTQALNAANDVAALAAGEATGWGLDAMTYKPGAAGFVDLPQALQLIGGAEIPDVYLLQRSWLPSLGIRPVFGVMGGTIGYSHGAWSVSWRNAPISAGGTQPYLMTWDHIDNGDPANTLVWDDEPGPTTVDDSVTYDDLGFAAYGLGVTTIPTDGS